MFSSIMKKKKNTCKSGGKKKNDFEKKNMKVHSFVYFYILSKNIYINVFNHQGNNFIQKQKNPTVKISINMHFIFYYLTKSNTIWSIYVTRLAAKSI